MENKIIPITCQDLLTVTNLEHAQEPVPNRRFLTREKAVLLLKSYEQKESDQIHYLETEAIMGAVAEKLGEDIDYWKMLGLLHDVDWALTKDKCEEHCIKAEEILKKHGFDEEFIKTVQSHGYGYKEIPALKDKARTERVQHCLAASETLTGIIHAYALMRGRKISDMDASGLKKKFKDKRFAQNCNREIISEIEKAGISLDEFLSIAIEAVKKIKDNLGLS